MRWAILVVFVPATTNSYAHYGKMCGYATTHKGMCGYTAPSSGDVQVNTSTGECGQ